MIYGKEVILGGDVVMVENSPEGGVDVTMTFEDDCGCEDECPCCEFGHQDTLRLKTPDDIDTFITLIQEARAAGPRTKP